MNSADEIQSKRFDKICYISFEDGEMREKWGNFHDDSILEVIQPIRCPSPQSSPLRVLHNIECNLVLELNSNLQDQE